MRSARISGVWTKRNGFKRAAGRPLFVCAGSAPLPVERRYPSPFAGIRRTSVACGEVSCASGVRQSSSPLARTAPFRKEPFGYSFPKAPFLKGGRSRAPPVADAARRKPSKQGSARQPLLRQRCATIANFGQHMQPLRRIVLHSAIFRWRSHEKGRLAGGLPLCRDFSQQRRLITHEPS